MSISHCMQQALTIAESPRQTWVDAIAALPDTCEHTNCGEPRSCRKRISEYLRMQWRIQDNHERIKRKGRKA